MPIPRSNPERFITGVDGFPNKGTLPTSRLLTGTFNSIDTVVTGTGSLFTTEMVEGDWLYSTTTNELRQIEGIQDDTILILGEGFSSNVTGDVVRTCRTLYRTIMITISGTVTSTIDGKPWQPNEVESLNSNNSIRPIVYDASGGGQEITFDVVY